MQKALTAVLQLLSKFDTTREKKLLKFDPFKKRHLRGRDALFDLCNIKYAQKNSNIYDYIL